MSSELYRFADHCVVIGGGVIGLGIARRLAAAGLRVSLFDRREPGREASYAAAGMLCPRSEFQEKPEMLRLGLESLVLYPRFVKELEDETEKSLDLRLDGVLRPLAAEDEPAAPPRDARYLGRRELREIEPSLDAEGALLFEGEGSVDNRALTDALVAACRAQGVDLRPGCAVHEVVAAGDRTTGVRTEDGEFSAAVVINAAGAWAGGIRAPGPEIPVRPIKGQMLLLYQALDERVRLRHTVRGDRVYLVPRADGRVIVGTTVEDRGYDKRVEAEVVDRLLQSALELVPNLREAELGETWAGLRPLGSREPPMIGAHGPRGYFVAIGHYRNGILLTPLTVESLAQEVLG